MKNILFEAFINDLVMLGEKAAASSKHNPGDVWRTKGGFGAMNPSGNTDYFKDKKEANAFAKGRIVGKVTEPSSKGKKKPTKTKQAKVQTSKKKPEEKPTTPKDETPEYLQGRSGASSGVVGAATEITINRPDGSEVKLPVRSVLDEKGNPIDVSTSEGRAKASKRLKERIKELEKVTIRALKDFPKNTPASQWVGEVGEMYALMELLDQDVEAYMATASNPESDLIKIDRDETKGLTIVEISAKATKEAGAPGVKGANARAIFVKMAEGRQTTISGIEGSVSATTAVNVAYNVREQLGYMLTEGMVVEVPGEKDRALDLTDDELAKCTPEYQAAYRNPDTKVGGKSVRQNLAFYERSRIIGDDDIDRLRDKMLADVDSSKKKTDEEKEKEKVLVEHYIEQARGLVGQPLSSLRQKIIDDMGEIFDSTDPPTDLVIDSDLVVIRFNPQTGVPEIKIAKWESVKDCIDEKERTSRGTTVGQVFPSRDVDPELADKPMGDVIDAECKRPNGTMKWKCQFMMYVGHSFPSQARLQSAKGGRSRRGKLQLKLNWSPPKNCVEENLQDTAEYVRE
jgi:hypothetical protein